jgi:hypothetical protein
VIYGHTGNMLWGAFEKPREILDYIKHAVIRSANKEAPANTGA